MFVLTRALKKSVQEGLYLFSRWYLSDGAQVQARSIKHDDAVGLT